MAMPEFLKKRTGLDAPGWDRKRASQDLFVLGSAFAIAVWCAYQYQVFGSLEGELLHSEKRIDLYELVFLGVFLCVGMWIFSLRRLIELRQEIARRAEAEHRANEAEFRAYHDPLTGLGNRAKFDAGLDSLALSDGDAENGAFAALLLLDLNGFKGVNDRLGHPAGDAVLKIVSSRLHANVRREDEVSRLGGDEFAIVSHGPEPGDCDGGDGWAEGMAEKIMQAIDQPMDVHGNLVKVGVSIGIAYFPRDGRKARDLFEKADAALYAAKEDARRASRSAAIAASGVTGQASGALR